MAKSAQLYCICTCGANSKILEIDNCTNCSKAHCIANIPDLCKDKSNGEINSECFRIYSHYLFNIERDSFKDKFMVYLFLFITFGLLSTACLKPYILRYLEVIYILFILQNQRTR